MTIAALGDIHGNLAALKACLERIERENVSTVLFMGDYVSDCACPRETLDLISAYSQTHDCRFVRGNREQYMLDHRAGKSVWRRGTSGGSLLYTYESLTEADFAFFETMPAVRVERFDALPGILCCHGSPEALRGVPAREVERVRGWLDAAKAGVLLCAHTHAPMVRTLEEDRLLVNTGSVGMAVDTPGYAQFVLLDGENGRWQVRPVNQRYNTSETLASFSEKGFYDAAKLWAVMMARQIEQGGEWGVRLVETGMAMAQAEGLSGGFENMPEELWQRAAQRLDGLASKSE